MTANIFFDASELRHPDMSRLLLANITVADSRYRPLPNLELFTNADYLLVLDETPVLDWWTAEAADENVRTQLSILLNTGAALLVQRKSGSDMLDSIPKLSDVQLRMQLSSSAAPVLVAVGDYRPDPQYKVIVNDKGTGYAWNAFIGALTAWQFRGGFIQLVPDHLSFTKYLELLQQRLQKSAAEPVQQARRYQELTAENAIRMLETLPGIGPMKAQTLYQTYGSAQLALHWLTDPIDFPRDIVNGAQVQRIREWLGCTNDKLGLVPLIDDTKDTFVVLPIWQFDWLRAQSPAALWQLYQVWKAQQ